MADQSHLALPSLPDGTFLVRSAFKDSTGAPRFVLPVPARMAGEMAMNYLIFYEERWGGYEYPFRLFFDTHLRPGDVFVDVGAHWGLFALSAATRWPGQVDVIAIEPEPENLQGLRAAVRHNGLDHQIEIVAAAAGEAGGSAPLVLNTSMGHSLFGVSGVPAGQPAVTVPIITLDTLLPRIARSRGGRVYLKIDTEGYEPRVLAGAGALLGSGRVAAILWENGRAFRSEPLRGERAAMLRDLGERGFTLCRFARDSEGGALLPFASPDDEGNVFCLAKGFVPAARYPRPPGPRPPFDPDARA